jgi:hypothetical protein
MTRSTSNHEVEVSDVPQHQADPQWFRAPTRREHLLAAGLFVAFGAFFVMLFFVNRGWWFRWVILMLGGISIWHGVRHALDARHDDSGSNGT